MLKITTSIIYLLLITSFLPGNRLNASAFSYETLEDKRIQLAMRTVGHEVLTAMGDCDSRVMPIQQDDNQFIVGFEREISLDPEVVVQTVRSIFDEHQLAALYFVEIITCGTKEIVHSHEVGNTDMAPCQGRALPEGCYQLRITLTEEGQFAATSGMTGLSGEKQWERLATR